MGKLSKGAVKMKILEWNINKRTRTSLVEPFVCERILSQEADIICLVEYTEDLKIKNTLEESYWFFESANSSGNQILLAVKKSFVMERPVIVRDYDEYNCYNFLHIKIKTLNEQELSVLGVRLLTSTGKNRIDAEKQTPPLNKYLKSIHEPFLCAGDFNIREYRMSYWFPDYRTQEIEPGNEQIEESSYFFPKNNREPYIETFGILDHILTGKDLRVSAKYNWDFVNDHDIYPSKSGLRKGCYWNIAPGFPDHAMLIANVSAVYEKPHADRETDC